MRECLDNWGLLHVCSNLSTFCVLSSRLLYRTIPICLLALL